VLVPDEQLAFVILTNNINSVPSMLTYEILDHFLQPSHEEDWYKIFMDFRKEDIKDQQQALAERETNRIPNTKPSLALFDYAGTYTSEMYGDVLVTIDPNPLTPYGGLKIDFAPTALFKGQLTHWHYDTFELSWSTQMMLPKGKATFVLNADGKPAELKVVVDNPDFDFTELILLRKQDD
jgi:hypothetical protein